MARKTCKGLLSLDMLYAEHILRRLNSIGREGAVLKEIELNLPEDLQSLYAVMLSECQRHRTPDQFKTLKRLFAWLAFSKRPLSFGEAKDLVSVMTQEGSFSIEDEIQGRSARYYSLRYACITAPSLAHNADSFTIEFWVLQPS